jgi:hypothetical protein
MQIFLTSFATGIAYAAAALAVVAGLMYVVCKIEDWWWRKDEVVN